MSRPGPKRTCAASPINVRYWHLADMALVALQMSAFGGKADMTYCTERECLLLTQSGHRP